ncbi:MAG: prepilin-type N-terminal cleavage/methylation domain-containing protein [Woeseiaceae bacterium]|nr:prepilin-type N-terminal cleavage/methylation domain-containing protein [Woeseiaceae bacterium]
MQNVPVSRQGGLTLIELVVVISVIAIIAAIAYPALPNNDSQELDAAAAEFAAAIRFARTESIRTGKPHGFRFLTSQYRIRVFRADTQFSPWTWIWDVYHPIDKQLYDYTFPDELAGSATPVTHDFVYRGTCTTQGVIYFDEHGTPWCLEPETILLESYRLDFVTDTAKAAITLDGITGRVTVL